MRSVICLVILATLPLSAEDWPVWGGKNRDFIVNGATISDKWPATGPKQLWSRDLGDGYSAIAEEAGVLYTTLRRGGEAGGSDVIIALDAKSGKTIWEQVYANPFTNAYTPDVGAGPYAMPQVVGDRLITASGTGKIQSLDKKTGKVIWSHDLYQEFHGTEMIFGYSCQALPYKNTLIFMSGGPGNSAIAFNQDDGKVVWKNLTYDNGYSSPILIHVDGQEQIATVFGEYIVGFSPTDGHEYWRYAHKEPNHGINISTPVWTPGNLLFAGTAYGLGSRVLEVHQAGGKSTVKQLWENNRFQLHFGDAILDGGTVYFSSGHNGPVFLTAVDLKTGAVKWQDRTFKKAQLLKVGDKLILLDEDGTLALLRATPEKMEVLSRVDILKNISWTAPTLVGSTLYVRDRHTIAAYDLGAR